MLTMAQVPLPTTGPFTNKDGEKIGTATTWGNHIYVRDLKGEIVITIEIGADGTRTIYDPNGKILDRQLPAK